MTGYTKLFNSILGSSIWQEDPVTKVVWITLLALSDRDGVVEASVPGLAHFARVTVDEANAAVNKFLSPDPWSRTPADEGRRIEPVDGGWRLVNHEKYREKLSPEDMREKDRIRQQRYRDRQKEKESVTPRHALSREIQHPDPDKIQKHTQGERMQKRHPPSSGVGSEAEEHAKRVIDELALVAGRNMIDIISMSIEVLAKVDGLTLSQARDAMIERAKSDVEFRYEPTPRWWFEDRRFLAGRTRRV